MRCQCCQQQPATIQIRDTESWAVKDIVLICDACAQAIVPQFMNTQGPLPASKAALSQARESMGTTASGEGGPVISDEKEPVGSGVTCPACGMTYKEFQKAGRLGCPECYKVFADTLVPVLERIHGAHPPKHTGRTPGAPAPDSRSSVRQRVQTLKRQMDAAVKEENYERAAQLRDEISGLEKDLKT